MSYRSNSKRFGGVGLLFHLQNIKKMKKFVIVLFLCLFAVVSGILSLIFAPLARLEDAIKRSFYWILARQSQPIREIVKMYDCNGLKHNIDYLNTIRNKVAFLPIEQQAEFADKTTVDAVNCGMESIFYQSSMNDNYDFSHINTTSIGNMAYIALYSSDMELRKLSKSVLDGFKAHLSSLIK